MAQGFEGSVAFFCEFVLIHHGHGRLPQFRERGQGGCRGDFKYACCASANAEADPSLRSR
jgi:hypothetical protein